MANLHQYHSFKHHVPATSVAGSIGLLLKKMWNYRGCPQSAAHMPLVIAVNARLTQDADHTLLYKSFLKSLREIQDKYFVRFKMDLFWGNETKNTDVFYCVRDGDYKACEFVWDIKAYNKYGFDINVTYVYKKNHHTLVNNTGHLLTLNFKIPSDVKCPANLSEHMDLFYRENQLAHELIHHDIGFHVLFLEDPEKKNYITLPIYGMTLEDARRKYLYLLEDFRATYLKSSDFLADRLTREGLVSMILDELRSMVPQRHYLSNQIYKLSELAFACTQDGSNGKGLEGDYIFAS